jgi:hypothetical protein
VGRIRLPKEVGPIAPTWGKMFCSSGCGWFPVWKTTSARATPAPPATRAKHSALQRPHRISDDNLISLATISFADQIRNDQQMVAIRRVSSRAPESAAPGMR